MPPSPPDGDASDLGPPPLTSFASDNAAGVSPEVMAALGRANDGPALAYGEDPWSTAASDALRDLFDAPVDVLLCWGGTGANVAGLASVLQPWQAVLAPDTAHIVVDECGAPARFTGATIAPVPHVDGKLVPDSLEPWLDWCGVTHHPQPRVLSISQCTEMGTVYSVEEIAALCDLAHRHGMVVHVDGARIANAVAASGVDVRRMLLEPGVDLMTFGFTKNGAMYGEALVHLTPALADRARFVHKQAAQLPSKTRYVAAQVTALLTDDLWLRNATRANDMATLLAEKLRDTDEVVLDVPVESNAVFPRLPAEAIGPLQEWSFFWPWDLARSRVRWMTSFATTEEDVDRFVAGVRRAV